MKKALIISTACAFAFALSGMAAAQTKSNKTMEKSETQSTTGPNATHAPTMGKAPVTAAERRMDRKLRGSPPPPCRPMINIPENRLTPFYFKTQLKVFILAILLFIVFKLYQGINNDLQTNKDDDQ